jgi:tetratricopeptide (TPR) repeat protein
MYIAQLYYWLNDIEKAIVEYKKILRTAPEWFVWKHLGDICEDTEVKISMYCKAMTMIAKDEYIGELRLNLAGLLLERNKEQAAYEIEQYMKTYRTNVWNISGDVYLLQGKLQGVVPSTQSKLFYRNNVAKAEDFVYSDIPVEELTYTGIVTNHAGKEKASLVNKRKKIFLRTSLTPLLRKAVIGDVFLVRVYEHQKRTIALTIHPTEKKNVQSTNTHSAKPENEAAVAVSGVVSFPEHGEFCFIDHQYFVPEKLTKASNLKAGESVKAKAKKMPDGRWRVVKIIR